MAQELIQRHALMPNMARTTEGQPVFYHGGAFGNISVAANSLLALRAALKLGKYVITEAGFAADLGGEKFFDVVARLGGLKPAVTVVAVSVDALLEQGRYGDSSEEPLKDDEALKHGFANLDRHVANLKKFGVPILVAINRFDGDKPEHLQMIKDHAELELQVPAELHEGVQKGGEGAEALAKAAIRLAEGGDAQYQSLYELRLPIKKKIEIIAKEMYGASGVDYDEQAEKDLAQIERDAQWSQKHGGPDYTQFPIVMAKTQWSISDDPRKKGAPTGWRLSIDELKLNAGAGFIVPVAVGLSLMPALNRGSAQLLGYETIHRAQVKLQELMPAANLFPEGHPWHKYTLKFETVLLALPVILFGLAPLFFHSALSPPESILAHTFASAVGVLTSTFGMPWLHRIFPAKYTPEQAKALRLPFAKFTAGFAVFFLPAILLAVVFMPGSVWAVGVMALIGSIPGGYLAFWMHQQYERGRLDLVKSVVFLARALARQLLSFLKSQAQATQPLRSALAQAA